MDARHARRHLRHGAEAALRGIEGARRGGDAVMYPGGEVQRDSEIRAGAGRPAGELVAELGEACDRIEQTFAGLSEGEWDASVQTRRGLVAVRELLLQRWLDVEVHHVDLDLGHAATDWPAALVDVFLPRLVGMLPDLRQRPDADRTAVGSWHLHRSDGPGEWTVYADPDRAWTTEGHEPAACALRGSGRSLLALMLGRHGEAALEVHGDDRLAGRLKDAFPGP